MNRRLKNMLKNTYGSEVPNRKYSFIQELQNNPVWRKLHPISSAAAFSPALKIVLSTAAVAAVGAGIIAYNSAHDTDNNEPAPPDIPPVITETTLISSETTSLSAYTTETVTDSVTYTETFTTAVTYPTEKVVNAVSSAETATDSATTTARNTRTTVSSSRTTVKNSAQNTVQTSTTSVATDSVYYTHLFRHDYTLEEAGADDTLLYGYPDSDIANEAFEFAINNGKDCPYIYQSLEFVNSLIAEGEIISVEYTAYEGRPWTICDIKLSEVFCFYSDDVKNTGDIIRVAMAGGYMPVSEYIALNPDDTQFRNWTDEKINSTVIYEDGGNNIMPKVGDTYLYVMNENTSELNGEEIYTRLSYSDMFQFYSDGTEYICCNPAVNGHISYNELKSLTEKDRRYFSEPDGDRCIMIQDESFLFDGRQSYYSIDSDGKAAFLDSSDTDDSYFPYRSDFIQTADQYGRAVLESDDYSITWTDTGALIKYRTVSGENFFDTIELNYPKTSGDNTDSVYYTHLFSHITSIDEADEIIDNFASPSIYGYPDYNYCEDIIRQLLERNIEDIEDGETLDEYFKRCFIEWCEEYGENPDEFAKENGIEIGINTKTSTLMFAGLITGFFTKPLSVEGEITGMEYIAYDGRPWTIYDLTLTKVYKFDYKNVFNKGDTIKIAMAGGYMPVSEYIALNPDDTQFSDWTDEQINSTVIYEDGGNQTPIKIGDIYTFLLSDGKLPDFPADDCYFNILVNDVGKFRNEDGNLISCNSHFSDMVIPVEAITEEEYFVTFKDADSDRTIAFKDDSFLMYGAFECYAIDKDERFIPLEYLTTDDGYFPFYDEEEYIYTRDEYGRYVIKGDGFVITWTDTGIILEYKYESFRPEFEKITIDFDIPAE